MRAQQIDDAGQVGALTVISGASAFAAMLTMRLARVLTDRTRSRFGARCPLDPDRGCVGPAVASVVVLDFGGDLALYVTVVIIGALAVIPFQGVR